MYEKYINVFLYYSISFNSFMDLTSKCVSVQQQEFICSRVTFFFPPSSQFLSTSTTGPHWRPQTALWCSTRLMRFWRRRRIRRQTHLGIIMGQRHCWDRLEVTCQSSCLSLWWYAQEKGPSSVCCSCWGLCGWVTPSTSSRGGTLTYWT